MAVVGFEPRPYQQAAYDGVLDQLYSRGLDSTMVVQSTGTGKTIVISMLADHIVNRRGEKLLVLAHRGLLLEQAAAKLDAFDVDVALEKAESKALGAFAKCVVGSVQTMRGERLKRWPRDAFDAIIVDEAHHAAADSYGTIFGWFEKAKRIGFTATPDRLDEKNIGSAFESLAAEYHLDQAINDGWLSPLLWYKSATQVDLSGIDRVAGDFNLGQLEDRLSRHIEPLVNATKEVIGQRRAMVFTPKVASAEAFAAGLTRIGIPSRALSAESKNRSAVEQGFRDNEFQVLCNCMLYCEGADFPFLEAVVLARPTGSRALLSQMVGRGTRRYHGKENALVVDFTWLCDRHRLVSPVELIVPEADGQFAELVELLLGSGREVDLQTARDRAQQIQEARESQADRDFVREMGRRQMQMMVRERESGIAWQKVNPLGATAGQQIAALPIRESFASTRVLATEKQVGLLTRLGFSEQEAKGMSRRAASEHIDWLLGRAKDGLSTLPQMRALMRLGLSRDEAAAMTKQAASERLEATYGQRRRPMRAAQSNLF